MGNQLSTNLPEDWVTVDMLAQHAYCPRRFHLMYIQGRWQDNEHTIEGKTVHRRVDRIDHLLPEATQAFLDNPDLKENQNIGGDPPPVIARSVSLGSEALKLMGKLDLVSADPEGGEAVPVETKKSSVPNTPQKSYPPERIQLMAQALLLREHGYQSDHGYIYYAGSRTRIRVEFTTELETQTRKVIDTAISQRASDRIPAPLEDSPKCWGCSLCGICLPDETRVLQKSQKADSANLIEAKTKTAGPDIRRLYAARDHRLPFYIQEQGARVGKKGERLVVSKKKQEIGNARLMEVSQVVLMGNVQISAQATNLLLEKGIPIIHLSTGGWFHGISHGIHIENAYARAAQYEVANDPQRCIEFSKQTVVAKIANQRALIMRNSKGPEKNKVPRQLAGKLSNWKKQTPTGLDQLLGWEGQAAALYFSAFSSMFKTGELPQFNFNNRNRRPPLDPVNALLSYSYALLAKECTVALLGEGLDPWWGLYHQPRHGRPALALDMMEPFRPIIADSVVLTAINTGMVQNKDFITNANGCTLLPSSKKALLRAWEQRLDQLFTHPEFDYRCSWRTIIRIQARLLTRWLKNDIDRIPWPIVR